MRTVVASRRRTSRPLGRSGGWARWRRGTYPARARPRRRTTATPSARMDSRNAATMPTMTTAAMDW
ncbi:hypothetical protein AS200_07450 [Streptomyces sp. CdTB01]|nr:hypothetical protein AS200_07450 [Streptomyces sp. CdTB01]